MVSCLNYSYLPKKPGSHTSRYYSNSIKKNTFVSILTFFVKFRYNNRAMLAGEESSLAPLPFPNLGASTASALISL